MTLTQQMMGGFMTMNADNDGKYCITIERGIGRGIGSFSGVEVSDIEELKKYLKEHDHVSNINLVSRATFDDSFVKYDMKSVGELTHSDLVWLAEKDKYTVRYIRE